MSTNQGSAKWNGGLKSGNGSISTLSGALKDYPYSFTKRFEGERGLNPEELIGAAHASCFSMALSMMLEQAGMPPEHVHTQATITLDKDGDGFAVTKSHLDVIAKIPGAEAQKFEEIAAQAKAGCPISKLLSCEISMAAQLEA